MKVLLFGAQADEIRPAFGKHLSLKLVEDHPEVVVCYGGDGTLLTAERRWPHVPKVPIRNSRRGNRCIARPAPEVIERLVEDRLIRTEYMKLECAVKRSGASAPAPKILYAMNEFSVHMAHINAAVRFRMWIDEESYGPDREVLGDGFVVSTPFGSTAYFNHITRGFFRAGIGIAFKSTSEHTNHLVVPEDARIRILITRGPALLAYDNSEEYMDLTQDDTLVIQKHDRPAVLLTWSPMLYPCDAF